ncbi:hypothetical protein CDD81_692 [Ophiocordyceps australis]|uniref:Cytochrome P450 n=1 Tax=Ophiocordyceps australis TaxID=1399860 RepID=A0A2C5Y2U6_9HYPO|nr:hypothetical protein CDD81_692 [Ophiocordyceps australis]
MPKEQGHKQFAKWAREYGPIYSLILGTKVVIVLSKDEVVKDLLDRRSAIYSSRPDIYLGQTILSGGLRVLLMPYGDVLRKIHKMAHRILNKKASFTYTPYQDLESKALLIGMLERPDQFVNHLRRFTTSLTTQMTFGFRITDESGPTIQRMSDIFDSFSELATSQTAALLDVYPILRRLPDVALPMRRLAKELHTRERSLFINLFQDTKRKLRDGKAKACLCTDLARIQEEEGLSDAHAGYMCGSLLQAGSETTSAVLIGFVQAMVIFPHVAKTAQIELDRVCGDRLPTLDDAAALPYIQCCIKESLRWMPTAMLGVPHAVTRDDEYMGYQIPKDATIILNVWAIHTDAQRYSNPRQFDPTRWAHDHQSSYQADSNADNIKRDHFTFGAGRRFCQGTHIAERSLCLAIARLLWTFDFGRARDSKTGHDIVPDMDHLSDGMFTMPQPFRAKIRPRDDIKARVIQQEWKQASEEWLDEDMQWIKLPEGLIWADV